MKSQLSASTIIEPDVVDNPYPFYSQLRSETPVWNIPGTEIYAVTSFALLAEAARRVDDFSSNMTHLLYRDERGCVARLPFGSLDSQALATVDPPLHTLHKKTVFPEFVGRRMAELEPEIVALAQRLVDEALDEGTIDFMAKVGNLLPITVISNLIGFKGSNLQQLLQAAFDSTDILGATMSLPELGGLMSRSDDISAWIASQLSDASEEGQDMLASIGAGVRSGIFTPEEGRLILHTMLSAGGESTTSLLGNAVRILAENPDLQTELREKPELIESFIEEALRFEAPFRQHMRHVYKATKLGDVDIPAGSTVLMMWGAANRDPEQFERPDEVILGRTRRHVTFGRGIHTCIGAPLARLEAKAVFGALLKQTKWLSLASSSKPQWVQSLLVRRHDSLPVEMIAA